MNRRQRRGALAPAFCWASLFLFGISVTAFPALAEERSYLTVGAGAFGFLDQGHLSGAFTIEYRFGSEGLSEWGPPWFHGLGPEIGLQANTEGGLFGFADLFLDLQPTERLVIWPGAGLGGYRQGNSRDLGGIQQFHLGLFGGYRLAKRHLLGFSLQHISNAGTQETDPGTNALFLTYSLAGR